MSFILIPIEGFSIYTARMSNLTVAVLKVRPYITNLSPKILFKIFDNAITILLIESLVVYVLEGRKLEIKVICIILADSRIT